jgi:hypothetical protein
VYIKGLTNGSVETPNGNSKINECQPIDGEGNSVNGDGSGNSGPEGPGSNQFAPRPFIKIPPPVIKRQKSPDPTSSTPITLI